MRKDLACFCSSSDALCNNRFATKLASTGNNDTDRAGHHAHREHAEDPPKTSERAQGRTHERQDKGDEHHTPARGTRSNTPGHRAAPQDLLRKRLFRMFLCRSILPHEGRVQRMCRVRWLVHRRGWARVGDEKGRACCCGQTCADTFRSQTPPQQYVEQNKL